MCVGLGHTSSVLMTGCIIATAGSHSLPCSHHLQNQCSPAFVLLLSWVVFTEVEVDTRGVGDKLRA